VASTVIMSVQVVWFEILGAIINVRFFEENFGKWSARHLMAFVKKHNGKHLNVEPPTNEPTRVWKKEEDGKPVLETITPSNKGFDPAKWKLFYEELDTELKQTFLEKLGKDWSQFCQFSEPVTVNVETGHLLVHYLDVWHTLCEGFNVYAGDEPAFMEFLQSKGFGGEGDEDELWEAKFDNEEIRTFVDSLSEEDQMMALASLQEDWECNANEY